MAGAGFDLRLAQGVAPSEYENLLASADVGLSLRLPGHGLGETTFPSKVIEYASNGLLVVTTKVSDVAAIFVGGTAAILESADANALAKLIVRIVTDWNDYGLIAQAGNDLVRESFASEVVGRKIIDFLSEMADAD
jgi:glycosyltransferase involved in cell wall biosynthesis